jgi:catechol 2,3-dioxygenase
VAIHPDTEIGTVRLTVSDLGRSREFYERTIGLSGTEREDGTLALGAPGEPPLIELTGDPSAAPLDHRKTGLYHLAILLPSRHDLGLALRRLAEAHWPLTGASDHLVSEALYLRDPDGNGIEIYRDRPRDEWPHADGKPRMATLPLDLDDVLRDLRDPDERARQIPGGTRIGHVHLQIADLAGAEEFYSGVLGFDVTVRDYPGALFVSAGGYHHHIGLNTWHSAGSGPPAAGTIGLRSFEVVLPQRDELGRTLEALGRAGVAYERTNGSALTSDPSGNGILLTAR